MDMLSIEKQLYLEGFTRIMGLDEVGRGCLAGPVVAAGVILDPNQIPVGINDSKQLDVRNRDRLSHEIKEKALFWTIQSCDVHEIAALNILWASMKAMQLCETSEHADPDYLLIDGNRYLDTITPHATIVKGDAKSASIAAASILAKVYRDKLMGELHQEYPVFNWIRNVGYPTPDHYKALLKYGYTKHHRSSFNLKTSIQYQEK
jgi:ribonuclease HII